MTLSPGVAELVVAPIASWAFREEEREDTGPACRWREPKDRERWLRRYALERGHDSYDGPLRAADAAAGFGAGDLLDALRQLAEELLDVRLGAGDPQVHVRDWAVWCRLTRLIDPDLLACLHPDWDKETRPSVEWPPFVTSSRSNEAIVDLHLHLATVLTPRDRWRAHMSGFLRDTLAGGNGFEELAPHVPTEPQDVYELVRTGACLRWQLIHEVLGHRCEVCVEHDEHARDLAAWLCARHGVRRRRDLNSMNLYLDPLDDLAPPDWSRSQPGHLERRLVLEASRNRAARPLLIRYLRCRAVFWRMGVVGAERAGFEWFDRFFEASKPRWKKRDYDRRLRIAWERHRTFRALVDLGCSGVKRLELRVRPEKRAPDLLREFRSWLEGLNGAITSMPTLQARFVAHLVRTAGRRKGPPERWDAADKEPKKDRIRAEAYVLARFVRDRAKMAEFLVGCDVAGVETDTVAAAFSDAYRRAFSSLAGIGLTFHAGEEWRELLSGIRECDVVIRHLLNNGERGRRVGHGYALLELAERRYRPGHSIAVPRWERALNLLWELHLYEDGRLDPCRRQGQLRQALRDLQVRIPPGSLWDTVCRIVGPDSAREELRLQRPKDLHTRTVCQDEARVVDAAQKVVREDAARFGILLEVCPTSNMCVRGLETLADHPLVARWPDVPLIAICSDNPGLFAVTAASELSAIGKAFADRGRSRADIDAFRRAAREASLRYTFLPPLADDPASGVRADLHRLNAILGGPRPIAPR